MLDQGFPGATGGGKAMWGSDTGIDRRVLMQRALAGAGGLSLSAWPMRALAQLGPKVPPRILPAQWSWDPVPPLAAAREGMAELPGVRLYFWDTGGTGEPIMLLHPITGSALVWGYQQSVFAKAGYRVIAFSRRGHARSESGPLPIPAGVNAPDDVIGVADFLNLDKFHLVGTAGGGFILPDLAQSYGDRLLSMTITCSQGGLTEPSYRERIARLTPAPVMQTPNSFRELGPSYRAGNPQGMAQWEALEHAALSGPTAVRPPPKNRCNFADIEKITTPTFVLAGAADLYAPPTLMFEMASHLQNVEVAVLPECGHSGYWEQPIAFNNAVLDFIGRHKGR